jgi:hypothetical protein
MDEEAGRFICEDYCAVFTLAPMATAPLLI